MGASLVYPKLLNGFDLLILYNLPSGFIKLTTNLTSQRIRILLKNKEKYMGGPS
jgi:hypothetical protein